MPQVSITSWSCMASWAISTRRMVPIASARGRQRSSAIGSPSARVVSRRSRYCWISSLASIVASLHFAAALEGAAQRAFVGVFEVAADGQAARQARHHDVRTGQQRRDVGGGVVALVVGVCSEDYLAHRLTVALACAPHARHQLVYAQVARADALYWRERAVQHVVEALEGAGLFQRQHIQRLLDDADDAAVALEAGPDRAQGSP